MYKGFCEQVQLQFQRHMDAVDSLGKKSRDLMTVSGIITTILVGLYGQVFMTISLPLPYSISISIGVFLMIATVVICVVTNRIEFKRNPFLGEKLLDGDQLNHVFKSWIELTEMEYYMALIEEYTKCLKEGEKTIEKKAVWLNISIILFVSGLVLISLILSVLFLTHTNMPIS